MTLTYAKMIPTLSFLLNIKVLLSKWELMFSIRSSKFNIRSRNSEPWPSRFSMRLCVQSPLSQFLLVWQDQLGHSHGPLVKTVTL